MPNPLEMVLQRLAVQSPGNVSVTLPGQPRSDEELLRILGDRNAPLDSLSNDDIRRLERLLHPAAAPSAPPPRTLTEPEIRPVTDITPVSQGRAVPGARSDQELLRLVADPQPPAVPFTADETRRLNDLLHPPGGGTLANPERPWKTTDPQTGQASWFATQASARGATSTRSDQELLKLFYDRSAPVESFSDDEVARLLEMLDPVPSMVAPTRSSDPRHADRPVSVMDPDPRLGRLWFQTPEDATAYLQQLGVEPNQLPGVYRGMRAPLPGGLTWPKW